jgi:molybdopterin molybdotransferase
LNRLNRVSVERAAAWIDAATHCLAAEDAALETAAGRVIAADIHAPNPIPPMDCAAIDGYAVRAEESLGAGAYNPLSLPAMEIESGEAVPAGTDAVVPFEQAEPDAAGRVGVVEPVAPGANVDRAGAAAAAGALLVATGACLTPRHIGLLAVVGFTSVPAIRRPRVRLVIAGRARSGARIDGNRPMLRALIERDGGIVIDAPLSDAFGAGADFVLVAGGARGREDLSAAVLGSSGSLDFHGVALVPGGMAGFGRTSGGAPVLLLPGAPADCLWNYELFAGRAIRRLGGHDPELPYRSRTVATTRKIVSAIGMTEICPIRRLPDGRVEPVASFAEAGLTAAIDADGFVIVPEACEGYPAGAQVTAYFYEERRFARSRDHERHPRDLAPPGASGAVP